jgi:hypothetical protein
VAKRNGGGLDENQAAAQFQCNCTNDGISLRLSCGQPSTMVLKDEGGGVLLFTGRKSTGAKEFA